MKKNYLLLFLLSFVFLFSSCMHEAKLIKKNDDINAKQAFIAGKFYQKKAKGFKISYGIQNIETKKQYELKFSKKNNIALFSVEPGEYIIKYTIFTAVGMFGLPSGQGADFKPFVPPAEAINLQDILSISEGEVLYLGNFENKIKSKILFKTAETTFSSNPEEAKKELRSKFPNTSNLLFRSVL